MTGQDLFSALTILILTICIVLNNKRKITLFDDDCWYNILVTLLFVLSLISTVIIVGAFFITNWKTQIL